MQRQSLVPLKSWMDKKGSTDGSGLSLLEVAGGTGRYATFVKVRSVETCMGETFLCNTDTSRGSHFMEL